MPEEQREALAARIFDSIENNSSPELTPDLKNKLDSRGKEMRDGINGITISELRNL